MLAQHKPGYKKRFREDAFQAFTAMGYTNESKLPKASVLNREPGSDDTRDCCPPLLWSLQQTHNVKRKQICYQLKAWKEKKNKGTLSKSKVNLLKQYCKQLLNKMVPFKCKMWV